MDSVHSRPATRMLTDLRSFIRDTSRWCAENTSTRLPASKSSSSGSERFATGNSGARLRLLVEKSSPDATEEGRYALTLGSGICPQVVSIGEGSYIMEMLEPIRPDTIDRQTVVLSYVENLLLGSVWKRDGADYARRLWRQELAAQIGQEVPDLGFTDEWCLVHGDPTLCNLAIRPYERRIILLDPRPPRSGIPPLRCVDQGKMLQSALCWESAAYGWPVLPYDELTFYHHDDELRRAMFWCYVAAHRIVVREKGRVGPRSSVLKWCGRVEQGCRDVAGF